MFNRIKDGMYWDRAWKLVNGCTPVSEGCAHCWSARETHMRAKNPNEKIAAVNRGKTTREGAFNGIITLSLHNLDLPIRTKNPTVWAIWNDLFHEDVQSHFISMAFDVMADERCEDHLFLVLTKRPERVLEYLHDRDDHTTGENPSSVALEVYGHFGPNVWLGVTAENQEQADKRIPVLLQTPAARRYVSIEPMLGPVDLEDITVIKGPGDEHHFGCLKCDVDPADDGDFHGANVDWVICGGESGPGARPMHPDWARSLRDQCEVAGVPFFFKQHGEWAEVTEAWAPKTFGIFKDGSFYRVGDIINLYSPEGRKIAQKHKDQRYARIHRVGKMVAGRMLDGKEWLEVPKV